jgi:hypothetical protein
MVNTALGYTAYSSTNPAGYITGITSGNVTTALGYTPYNSTNPSGYVTSTGSVSYATSAGGVLWQNVANRPTNLSNFINDLGNYGAFVTGTPWTGLGYLTGITQSMVNAALGYTAYSSTNPAGYITGITSGMVTTALGFTPISSSGSCNYATTAGSAPASGGTATNAGNVTHNASRTDSAWYNIGWFSGNPSPAYSCDAVQIRSSDGTIAATHYEGSGNVGGTGRASHHPSGVYSQGTNWLYGSVILNGNSISGVTTLSASGAISASNFSGSHSGTSSGTNTGDQTIPTSLPANDVYSWAKQSSKPSYGWTEISSKPTTLSGYGITDWVWGNYGGLDAVPGVSGCYYFAGNSPIPGQSDGTVWYHAYPAAPTTWGSQLVQNYRDGRIYIRGRNSGSWSSWWTVIDSNNIGSQSVSYATSAGSAAANDVYSWAKSSVKPSYSYSEVGAAAASHTHSYIPTDSRNSRGVTKLFRSDSDSDYYTEMSWCTDLSGYWSLRGQNAGSFHAHIWVGRSGSAGYADSAGSAPASDVSAWAKAGSKPGYSWSEISSRPTSLSQFSNDLGNYGGWAASGHSHSGYMDISANRLYDNYTGGAMYAYNGRIYNGWLTDSVAVNYSNSCGNADTVDGWHRDDLRAYGNLTGLPSLDFASHRGEGSNYIDYSRYLYDEYRGGWRGSSDLYVSYAYSSGNADTVDGQHFAWSNRNNNPTYLWAADSNGDGYLAWRGGMSVSYADSSGYAGSSGSISGYNNPTTAATVNTIAYRDGSGYITAVQFYGTSSRKLKRNIKPLEMNAIAFMNEVVINEYNWKQSGDFGIGFIAEDTHPWLSGKNQVSHNLSHHVGLLTLAFQQEDSKVEALQKRVSELEKQLKSLQDGR